MTSTSTAETHPLANARRCQSASSAYMKNRSSNQADIIEGLPPQKQHGADDKSGRDGDAAEANRLEPHPPGCRKWPTTFCCVPAASTSRGETAATRSWSGRCRKRERSQTPSGSIVASGLSSKTSAELMASRRSARFTPAAKPRLLPASTYSAPHRCATTATSAEDELSMTVTANWRLRTASERESCSGA